MSISKSLRFCQTLMMRYVVMSPRQRCASIKYLVKNILIITTPKHQEKSNMHHDRALEQGHECNWEAMDLHPMCKFYSQEDLP